MFGPVRGALVSNIQARNTIPMKLLSRDDFRNGVLARDKHTCVLCKAKDSKLDAHHLIERSLWSNGGYYLANGVSLCDPECHMKAEQTIVSCDELREMAGIKEIILPPQFSSDEQIDKWGNPILPNGMRMKGELFNSHQEILAPVLHLFTDKVKFPRTYHLPWSPGLSSDDRVLSSLDAFKGKEVVVTEKMDGENTTLTKNYLHARSLTYESHPSRSMIRAIHGQVAHEIPEGMRVCGENLYAKHSIHYKELPDWFLVFSIWDKSNVALSWDETKEWAELLGLKTVPEIYRGVWDEAKIRSIPVLPEREGYVVRLADEISYGAYRTKVGKWVRKDHVQSSSHWMNEAVVPNKLK